MSSDSKHSDLFITTTASMPIDFIFYVKTLIYLKEIDKTAELEIVQSFN